MTAAEEEIRQAVMARERQRFQALHALDYAALDDIFADELVYMHGHGRIDNKASYLANLEAQPRYQSMRHEDLHLSIHGDCVLQSGVLICTFDPPGNGLPWKARYTSAWVRRDATWRMALWQSTTLPDSGYDPRRRIAIGDVLPPSTLMELDESDGAAKPIDVTAAAAGKTIALFALPGAFTRTCSAKHLPGYVQNHDAFRAAGIDEIWCVSVNDGAVMGAWGRMHGAIGKVRMLGDGTANLTRAMALEQDMTERGMGIRSQRYSMLVKNGKIVIFNLEASGKYEVSDAATLLAQVVALKA